MEAEISHCAQAERIGGGDFEQRFVVALLNGNLIGRKWWVVRVSYSGDNAMQK